MSGLGRDLIRSLEQATRHARGESLRGVRQHVVVAPDVKAIRHHLRMSQQAFAAAFRIPLSTLKNWEQGRRRPDAPAAAYLHVIARRPRETEAAFSS
ncbi:MAG: helix-turn-helix domain-containing protein [Alphaproteobacteria bacterium]|nr:helix-turn-helix domain-containing protein [Alphaproteobacteria bacterium]